MSLRIAIHLLPSEPATSIKPVMLPPGPSQALDKAAAYGIRHAHEDNGYGLGFSLQGPADAFNRSRNHSQRVHWKPALLFNAVGGPSLSQEGEPRMSTTPITTWQQQ